jgi:hypothetical protein
VTTDRAALARAKARSLPRFAGRIAEEGRARRVSIVT